MSIPTWPGWQRCRPKADKKHNSLRFICRELWFTVKVKMTMTYRMEFTNKNIPVSQSARDFSAHTLLSAVVCLRACNSSCLLTKLILYHAVIGSWDWQDNASECTRTRHFNKEIWRKKILGRGIALPRPVPTGEGVNLLPRPQPLGASIVAPLGLHPGAFGARCRASPHWIWSQIPPRMRGKATKGRRWI